MLKKYWILIVGFLVFVIYYIHKVFNLSSFSNNVKSYSENNKIDSVISIIDESIGSIGYFNNDHFPIFKAISSLSSVEIIQLHHDFGRRFHNRITGTYKILDTGSWGGFTQSLDLNSILLREFETGQLKELDLIYTNKGLSFPMLK
ncbi:hypothetical protein C7447_102247 [Tenacibaculum adriaticum]|uniref:Uncharacterized protein n=1 Tax=Tenacibaculum adriaticum TaxID=413713 RepID=A0A5S5DWB4_9FLAO|nr:hypothetical protein [Tenacibaculum adriaticum]TYP98929.1 hypothetical protein C7447_102247 [Tenacibaculum adriaticum]